MSTSITRRRSARADTKPDSIPAGLAARRCAVEIVERVDAERAFADVLLGHALGQFANAADRRFVTQLVLGTIAWQGRLDYELSRISSRPLDRIEPRIRAILRMGLYQLRILTRVPAHAAVDTAVGLAREKSRSKAGCGFVNAVLRGAARKPLCLPDRAVDEIEYLSITQSHPRWLVERFIEWFGIADAEALMAANNRAAPNAIRLNLARGTAQELLDRLRGDGLAVTQGCLPETAVVDGAMDFSSASYRAGCLTPQSEASQLIAHLLAPTAGATVIDCAAAPGGKSTHLAEIVGSHGRVIACDRNRSGLVHLRALADRLGHHNVAAVEADTEQALPLAEKSAQYVLLDAPCTGLGTLREHPEIRWRLRPEDPARMANLQLRMLRNAAAIVAPGGVIVYAVCSIAPEEGRNVVDQFLREQRGFVIKAPQTGPLVELIDGQGFLRTRPDRDSRDGFFAARLRRNADGP